MKSPKVALIEEEFLLRRDKVRDHICGTGTHTRIFELADKPLLGEVEDIAEQHCIEARAVHIAIGDHQVVTAAALDQIFAIAVKDLAARRVQNLVAKYIAIREIPISGIYDLKIKNAAQDHRKDQNYYKLQGINPCEISSIYHPLVLN